MKVPDGSQGRRVKCPKCGHVQKVPSETVIAAVVATPAADPEPAGAAVEAPEPDLHAEGAEAGSDPQDAGGTLSPWDAEPAAPEPGDEQPSAPAGLRLTPGEDAGDHVDEESPPEPRDEAPEPEGDDESWFQVEHESSKFIRAVEGVEPREPTIAADAAKPDPEPGDAPAGMSDTPPLAPALAASVPLPRAVRPAGPPAEIPLGRPMREDDEAETPAHPEPSVTPLRLAPRHPNVPIFAERPRSAAPAGSAMTLQLAWGLRGAAALCAAAVVVILVQLLVGGAGLVLVAAAGVVGLTIAATAWGLGEVMFVLSSKR